jgi:hypothetical protein
MIQNMLALGSGRAYSVDVGSERTPNGDPAP